MVVPAIGHGDQLRNGDRHADSDHKWNICRSHYQGCCCEMFITQRTYHRGVDEVQGHLCQLSHDDRDRQLNRFICFCFFPIAHNPDKACKGNQVMQGISYLCLCGFPTVII